MLSASSLGRAYACPASHALPQVEEPRSAAATLGSACHEYLALIAGGVEPKQALALTPEAGRALAEKIDVGEVPRGNPEIALAYDVVTGVARYLPRTGKHRDYSSLIETEIAGTCDLIADGEDGRPAIIDWKTGGGASLDIESYRPQMDFYALAVARAEGIDTIETWIGIVEPGGGIGWNKRVLDVFDLADIAIRVRHAWANVQDEHAARERLGVAYMPDVVEGGHCRYCKAWVHCLAKKNVFSLAFATDAGLSGKSPADALLVARDAEQVAERIRRIVGEAVDRDGELAASDGRRVRRDSRGALRVFPARIE